METEKRLNENENENRASAKNDEEEDFVSLQPKKKFEFRKLHFLFSEVSPKKIIQQVQDLLLLGE